MRGVHGCFGGLGGGSISEHCLLGGLAIRFVWGLGEAVLRFLDPKNHVHVVFIGVSIVS